MSESPSAPATDPINTIIYNTASGEVVSFNSLSSVLVPIQQIPTGFASMMADSTISSWQDANLKYVSGGALVARATMGLTVNKTSFTADGVDEVTITGIPAGATASIDGVVSVAPETIIDGEMVITSNQVGKLFVSIKKIPNYLDWSTNLNAT